MTDPATTQTPGALTPGAPASTAGTLAATPLANNQVPRILGEIANIIRPFAELESEYRKLDKKYLQLNENYLHAATANTVMAGINADLSTRFRTQKQEQDMLKTTRQQEQQLLQATQERLSQATTQLTKATTRGDRYKQTLKQLPDHDMNFLSDSEDEERRPRLITSAQGTVHVTGNALSVPAEKVTLTPKNPDQARPTLLNSDARSSQKHRSMTPRLDKDARVAQQLSLMTQAHDVKRSRINDLKGRERSRSRSRRNNEDAGYRSVVSLGRATRDKKDHAPGLTWAQKEYGFTGTYTTTQDITRKSDTTFNPLKHVLRTIHKDATRTELETTSDPIENQPPSGQVCRSFFRTGGCRIAARCLFNHTQHGQQRIWLNKTQCLYQPCTNPACAYQHGPDSQKQAYVRWEGNQIRRSDSRKPDSPELSSSESYHESDQE